MIEKTTTIVNSSGIHARPAALFISEAKKYVSKITVTNLSTGKSADAKSMLKILTLGLSKGVSVRLCAQGVDEGTALDALVSLIDKGLGEE